VEDTYEQPQGTQESLKEVDNQQGDASLELLTHLQAEALEF